MPDLPMIESFSYDDLASRYGRPCLRHQHVGDPPVRLTPAMARLIEEAHAGGVGQPLTAHGIDTILWNERASRGQLEANDQHRALSVSEDNRRLLDQLQRRHEELGIAPSQAERDRNKEILRASRARAQQETVLDIFHQAGVQTGALQARPGGRPPDGRRRADGSMAD